MSSRWMRWIVTALLLTLGFGVPAQAKTPAAGAASLRQGGVLEGLTAYGVALFLGLKDERPCAERRIAPRRRRRHRRSTA